MSIIVAPRVLLEFLDVGWFRTCFFLSHRVFGAILLGTWDYISHLYLGEQELDAQDLGLDAQELDLDAQDLE